MTFNKNRYAIADLVLSVLMLVWCFLPTGTGPLTANAETRIMFHPYAFPLALMPFEGFAFLKALAFLAWTVPLYAIFRIAAAFAGNRMGQFGSHDGFFTATLRIFVTAVMLYVGVTPLLKFGDTPAWFLAQPPLAWVSLSCVLALNITSVVVLMRLLNSRNPVYREYREFRKVNNSKSVTVLDVFFRIRSKLFLAFLGIISIILLSLSILLLRNYRITILEAVGDAAKSQVEQASTNYRVNLGDSIALFEYLNRLTEQNGKAKFAYQDLTIYTNRKQELYIDDTSAGSQDMRAEYSTIAADAQYPDLPPLAGAEAVTWANSFSVTGSVLQLSDNEKRTVRFASPIIKVDTIKSGDAKVRRERLLGFSVMTFSVDTIMKPYFRTRSLVAVLTAFFLYLAIVLTYVIGNYIVNPLLFLRMNVRKISDILGTMIRGQVRVSSTSLVYNDCVTSHDEIKMLSTEINDMVTVIRGIVPYISASTLKQAEKGIASTTRKDLTFLFTDIRGFTTLCEGMQPEEVVGILNRYLDLETEIILNNDGDVDKFVGDEMMAFFEGPLKEENACRAAMQLRHAMMEEKEKREKEGLPIVAIGIGVNTGPVVFGSVGARDRMDFTSIGDTVNLAARLEGANKAYGSKSIITESVYEQVKETFLCRELDYIAVKGKNEPVRIFELLQEQKRAQPKLLEIRGLFEKGLAAYRKRNWAEAAESFRKNLDIYQDAPSVIFLERIEHFMQNPPPDDWDGVFRMTVK